MQNLNYHIENDIVCVFDVSDHKAQTLTALTKVSQDVVGAPGYLFLTSGTTSRPKFVLHSRSSLESSAHACQKWLDLNLNDRWMNVLSPHHMGGFSTYFRTQTLGLLPVYTAGWDLDQFVPTFEKHGCTLLSLVPAQVFEIVQKKILAPMGLRALLVGGGALDSTIKNEAKKLGWPLLRSLGSTETGSQIFTEKLDDSSGQLWALPHFAVKTDPSSLLQIKGEGLFTAYITIDARHDEPQVDMIKKDDDGFWTSSDRIELEGRRLLKFLGRSSDQIKILGHLVDLYDIRQKFEQLTQRHGLNKQDFYIDALPDAKSEHHLVLFKTTFDSKFDEAVYEWNQHAPVQEKIKAQYYVAEIPKSNVGKILGSKIKNKFFI